MGKNKSKKVNPVELEVSNKKSLNPIYILEKPYSDNKVIRKYRPSEYRQDPEDTSTDLLYPNNLCSTDPIILNDIFIEELGLTFTDLIATFKMQNHFKEFDSDAMEFSLIHWIDDDFMKLKEFVKSTLIAGYDVTSGCCLRKEEWVYRYNHTMRVVDIAKTICRLTKPSVPTWSVVFVCLMHDMFKFLDSKKLSHGAIAAQQFSNLCKAYDVPRCQLRRDMKEALANHSNKDYSLGSNEIFAILVDADMLSKLSLEQFKRKFENKGNVLWLIGEYISSTGLQKYQGKTECYDDLYMELYGQLKLDLQTDRVTTALNDLPMEKKED